MKNGWERSMQAAVSIKPDKTSSRISWSLQDPQSFQRKYLKAITICLTENANLNV